MTCTARAAAFRRLRAANSYPPPLGITVPPQGAEIVTHGQFPMVNGIPCNQKHLSTCYGMSQQP
jgi:hypothetical protein